MLIDVTRLADRALQGRLPTGVDRVSLAYLEHFGADASALIRFAGRWIELSRADSQCLFDALIGRYETVASIIRWYVGRAYVGSWKQSQRTFLFNTGHSGLNLPDYEVRVRKRQLKPLYFLHDLIPVTHPEYARPGEAERHQRRLQTMLSTGAGLIVNSRATLDELNSYAAANGFDLPPSAVALLAPGKLPQPSSRPPLTEPYFVMLSTIEPRKNHLMLLHLWRGLVEEMGERAPKLVLIGQRGWECEQIVDLLDRCVALKGVVIERADCNDRELSDWLGHAQALLFPSFVEGFGMPLVEALMLGVPVIASDLPVFREIAGDIPEYLDVIDGLGWRKKILEYMSPESQGRDAQLLRMAGYLPPSWKQHFSIVEDLIGQIDACG